MTPNDVGELLDEHIGNGKIIDRLWRFVFEVYFSVLFLVNCLVNVAIMTVNIVPLGEAR